jgi:hypothetical protein
MFFTFLLFYFLSFFSLLPSLFLFLQSLVTAKSKGKIFIVFRAKFAGVEGAAGILQLCHF